MSGSPEKPSIIAQSKPGTSSRRPAVVVVGAGLAGLTAARKLVDRGIDCIVLEARERVGGRTFSHTLRNGVIVDLGAQWIGPTQDRVLALAQELNLKTFKQYTTGGKVLSLGGTVATYDGPIPRLPLLSLLSLDRMLKQLDRMTAQVPLDAPQEAARAREWDAMTVETWKQRAVRTAPTRSVLDIALRAIFAAEPEELSFLFFLFYLHSGGGILRLTQTDGGAQQTRFAEGTQALSLRLAERLGDRVHYRAPVRTIAQDERGITVHTDSGEWSAAFALVAIPPTLAGRIAYDPPLPPMRDQLTQRMPMGSVLKCVTVYERPFWRERKLSGEAISDTSPVTLVFDDSPESGTHGALLAFVFGDHARQMGAMDAEERKAAVVRELVRLFGDGAAQPMDYVDMNWAAEVWSRGCYTGLMPPGVLTRYGAALRTPVGRIHWAGTETARIWNGYMDGAIESGERAADEILARI